MKWEWLNPLHNADGDIGAASGDGAASAEPPSVAAGTEPATGGAPAAAPQTTGGEPTSAGVTQQESFATRLREQTSKIEERYKPYETRNTRLEAVAKTAGFEDVDSYLEALDQHAQQQHAANEARRLNVDEETYQKYFAPVKQELNRTQQELQTLRNAESERAVRSEYDRLMSDNPDFVNIQDKVFDLVMERPGLTLTDAYKLVSYDEKVNAAKLAGQQEALQKLQANAAASPGAVGGDAPNQSFDITKLPKEEREKLYERAKRGELKSLR
ncbi:hypothetical protein RB620_04425 [Paenibacillus sp. LHD-117]|uniref:hypothetical protein n=1 Tax=Paenibacillus sp. LHD-117 TaxID=3071412 RepID=UPI0027E09A25|nr:hypothetical protein [Paenibacillus sp. LHD-117]MDQ6418678.1 hypothetical protein [Paenibacillus sp. LHD-117]